MSKPSPRGGVLRPPSPVKWSTVIPVVARSPQERVEERFEDKQARCENRHSLVLKDMPFNMCDKCGKMATAYRCSQGCDYDLCLSCSGAATGGDIVQFSSPLYYVEESEGKLSVDVMRLGACAGECRATFETHDASGKAGHRYTAAKGEVVFAPGEHNKEILIDIINTDEWATTLEFKIALEKPVNCSLDLYLYTCRVKVIDNDLFPSAKFSELLQKGEEGIEEIPPWALFWEFLLLNWGRPGIKCRTIKAMLLSQLQNLYLYYTLWANIYIVDVLFNFKEGEEVIAHKLILSTRLHTAYLIGALYIIPMVVLHWADLAKTKLDIGGDTQEFIQLNLFRKYLNYSEDARAKCHPSTMQMAIMEDSGEASEAYMASLEFVQFIGKLVVLIYFVLAENRTALIAIVTMPTAMLVFTLCRTRVVAETTEEADTKSKSVNAFVEECCRQYRLIADYMMRPQVCEDFQKRCEARSEAALIQEKVMAHNEQFPKWLGAMFVGIYVPIAGRSVLAGALSIGKFLATIKVFQELAESFEEGYSILSKENAALAPCSKLTFLFNLQTDLLIWKRVNRIRRADTRSRRKSSEELALTSEEASGPHRICRRDMIDIHIDNLSFAYAHGPALFTDVNLSVNQGKIVAIVGLHGSGKSALLQLLGHCIFPTAGEIFFPTHLRVVHVTQENVPLMKMSAWSVLTLPLPDADPARVLRILDLMDMPFVKQQVEKDLGQMQQMGNGHLHRHHAHIGLGAHDWQACLTLSQRAKVNLASALIMNPEVLVLHKPIIHYDSDTVQHVMEVLDSFVRDRGVCLPVGSKRHRRPRSLFFTPDSKEQAHFSDVIWRINMQQRLVETVTFEMISNADLT